MEEPRAGQSLALQVGSGQADNSHSPAEGPRADDISGWLRTPPSMKLPATPPSGLLTSLSASLPLLYFASQPPPRQGSQSRHHKSTASLLQQAADSAAPDSYGSLAAHDRAGLAKPEVVLPCEGSPVLLPCAPAAAGLASPPQPPQERGHPIAEALHLLCQVSSLAATPGISGAASHLSPVEQLLQQQGKVQAAVPSMGPAWGRAREEKGRHPPTPDLIPVAPASRGMPNSHDCHHADWQRMEGASRVQVSAAEAGMESGPGAATAQATAVGAALRQLLQQSRVAIEQQRAGHMVSQVALAPGLAGGNIAAPPQQVALVPRLQHSQAAPPGAAVAQMTPPTAAAAEAVWAVAAGQPERTASEKIGPKDSHGFTAERVLASASGVEVSGCSVQVRPAELPLQSMRNGHEIMIKPPPGTVEAPACEATPTDPASQADNGAGGGHEGAAAAPGCHTPDSRAQPGGNQDGEASDGRAAQQEPHRVAGEEAGLVQLNAWVQRQQDMAKATGVAPVWSSWQADRGPLPFKATFGSALLDSPTPGSLQSPDRTGSRQQGRPASAHSAQGLGPLAPPQPGAATVGGGAGECRDGKGFSMRSQRYKGVYRMPTGRWRAQFTHSNRVIQLGMFDTDTEAAHAWDEAAIKYRGASTQTNLPVERSTAEAWAAEPIPATDAVRTTPTTCCKPALEAARPARTHTGVSSGPKQPDREVHRVQGVPLAADSRLAQQHAAASEQQEPQPQQKRKRVGVDQPGLQLSTAAGHAVPRSQGRSCMPKRRRTAPRQANVA